MRPSISPDIQALREFMIEMRRDLHRHPEVGFRERRTAEVVAKYLERIGLAVRTGVGGTGVIGHLQGAAPGRTVLFRTELDALPIQEDVDVPWRSVLPNAMHACGHDANMAMNLAAVTVLARDLRDRPGTLAVVFQPAEELLSGAAAMLQDGALADLQRATCITVHVDNERPTGVIAVRSGPVTASADRLTITVTGRGGHGANPHLAADPVLAAAHVVTGLQSLISRETPPLQMAVLSLTTVRGGVAFNIIPDVVEMTGTLRCYDTGLRERLLASLHRAATSIGAGLQCTAEVKSEWLTPAMVNDPAVTAAVREAGIAIVGAGRVVEMEPLTGSDDLAYFRQTIPGCHVFVGSAKTDGPPAMPHHHPRFDIDEAVLEIGAELLLQSARCLFGRQ